MFCCWRTRYFCSCTGTVGVLQLLTPTTPQLHIRTRLQQFSHHCTGGPLAIDILVSKGHCSSCIDQGLPFWLTLFGKLPTRILYRSSSSSPRDGDRFARQIGIPDNGVVLVNDVPSTDSLLWSGTAPSVVVRDVQNGTRYLVHIGYAENRERANAFYTALTDQVHRRDSSRGPLSPGLVH